MNIDFTNINITGDLTCMTLEQFLIASTADCEFYLSDGRTFEMKEMACFWFIEQLLRSWDTVFSGIQSPVDFWDFYGEYQAQVKVGVNGCASCTIAGADYMFAIEVDREDLREASRKLLTCFEASYPDAHLAGVFQELEQSLL